MCDLTKIVIEKKLLQVIFAEIHFKVPSKPTFSRLETPESDALDHSAISNPTTHPTPIKASCLCVNTRTRTHTLLIRNTGMHESGGLVDRSATT